jgi:hypothetical protein
MNIDPFVVEVMRIIKKQHPWRHGWKTIVLVSYRFYDAAKEAADVVWESYGTSGGRCLYINGVFTAPAPWLSDYEFEIRPRK